MTWGILLALATAVVLLRLDRLDELPPGLMRDEELNGRRALSQEEPSRFIYLLSKYGLYQGSEEYAGHHFHSFTDISLEGSWRFYEELEPLTVDYDGGIALQGLALGQGAEQMSTAQALEPGRERPLWMALQWQIAPGLAIDYAVSLRLHDAAGERAFQEDFVLRNADHQHLGCA